MPFQPQASQAVLDGQDIFRINQRLESSGDIFRIDTSVKAIAIGPDSDLNEVRLTYFDPQAIGSFQTATVGVGRPFFGRIDALLAQRYPGSNQPANILVSLEDFIDNNYAPLDPVVLSNYVVVSIGGSAPSQGQLAVATPVLQPGPINIPVQFDLICYLNDPADVTRERSDKIYRFLPPVDEAPDVQPIIIPYFGRRFGMVSLAYNDFDAIGGGQFPELGIDLKGIRLNGGGSEKQAQVNLGWAYCSSGDKSSCQVVTRVSDDGEFDYLQATIWGSAPNGSRDGGVIIRVSDREN